MYTYAAVYLISGKICGCLITCKFVPLKCTDIQKNYLLRRSFMLLVCMITFFRSLPTTVSGHRW